jgi:hypothetical protein
VLLIQRTDDGSIGDLAPAQRFFPVRELVLRWDNVPFGCRLAPAFDGFGDGGDLQLVGVSVDPFPVYFCSPRFPAPINKASNGFF